MAKEESFDVVSKVDLQEVTNAVHQAQKELQQRFDLKDTGSEIELSGEAIVFKAPDDFVLKQVTDILHAKFSKREIDLKSLDYGKIEKATGGTIRQEAKLKQGIDKDLAKKITTLIKDSKLKVQAQIQGDQVRVVGKNRDDLQAVIRSLREANLDTPLQFINYR